MSEDKTLLPQQQEALINMLKARYQKHMSRHPQLQWNDVYAKLHAHPDKLWSLYQMEQTGGEPDVVGYDDRTGEYLFYDCSPESPKGRRSICYDREGQTAREKAGIHPAGNAIDMANAMGIKILNEDEYRALQQLGDFDTKTSSWIETPPDIRQLGGAIFADKRYNHVFIYHNSAQTFYSARGFRGCLRV
jgi:hypothetical protein